MARQLRMEYEGAIYHVMSRGDRREAIFLDDEDRQRFLLTLGEVCERADWQVHVYCLMGNHFHLVLETPRPTLVVGMKWFLGTYTQRFNARHRMRGHLFAGRYKSLLVDGADDFYLRVVCDYVHLNPLRAGMLKTGEVLEGYVWSSFPQYLKPASRRVRWLRVDRLLGEYGIRGATSSGRREFREIMERRCGEEGHAEEKLWEGIRTGWRFGADDFLERIAEKIPTPSGERADSHMSDVIEDTMEEKGRRLIRGFLRARKIGSEEFLGMRKGASLKIELAGKLRGETTLTVAWIARELNAGVAQTLWRALWERAKSDNTRD